MLKVHPLPAFSDNYIWVLQVDGSNRVAVVDPGDASPVTDYLSAHDLALEAILITHHHPDHTGGVEELAATTGAKVYGPAQSPFQRIDQGLNNGDRIEVLGLPFQVAAVPGHTLDHISYLQENHPARLFCGDTLFLAGCGRLFEGTPKQMRAAMTWFKSLPDETKVYCAHEYSLANLKFAAAVEPGNARITEKIEECQGLRAQERPTVPSSIGVEKAINPFMRTDQPAVSDAASKRAGTPLDSEDQIFSVIRQWKDNF
ncbi:hydroxyacylglutathione hydrolase [Motiliproteus sp. SC1-56]|uniref:hydroxyacylglutathione hydrolase n=1 Tax=Motiliproteus sp. SC1-56 TaxID=2799565 RepID=UPI001A8E0120|nr:hydroxyacylglutathione hydrolase [Motiliproteus sp. SC1-56]